MQKFIIDEVFEPRNGEVTMLEHVATSGEGLPSPAKEGVEVLATMRYEEREWLMPVGVASVEEDPLGRRIIAVRLVLFERKVFLPLWDLLILAGLDPRHLPHER